MTEPTGRRERKKAQTRQSLADAALELFLERGYDQVGVKEIADAADVSVTTLFKHFPGKESLLFDQEQDIEAALVAAVRERAAGQSIPDALREHLLRQLPRSGDPRMDRFIRLTESTPALREYSKRMWLGHETAVAEAIAGEIGVPSGDLACAALARFVLSTRDLIAKHPDPHRAAAEIFGLIEHGWQKP